MCKLQKRYTLNCPNTFDSRGRTYLGEEDGKSIEESLYLFFRWSALVNQGKSHFLLLISFFFFFYPEANKHIENIFRSLRSFGGYNSIYPKCLKIPCMLLLLHHPHSQSQYSLWMKRSVFLLILREALCKCTICLKSCMTSSWIKMCDTD